MIGLLSRFRRGLLVGLSVLTGIIAILSPAANAEAVGGPARQSTRGAAVAVVPACVDFLAIPDNTDLGNTFVRSAYNFQALGGFTVFVNETADLLGSLLHGTQFNNAGVRVAAPTPADSVSVTIGVFHPPFVQIRAFDVNGAVVDTAFVPADNIEHTVTLDGVQDITRFRFSGGGNEAIIQEICSIT